MNKFIIQAASGDYVESAKDERFNELQSYAERFGTHAEALAAAYGVRAMVEVIEVSQRSLFGEP